MEIMHNPRSKQYQQAYAWMTPEQRQHAYMVYLQDRLNDINLQLGNLDIASDRAQIDRLVNKASKLEAQIARLERVEYIRYMKSNERLAKTFKPD